MITVNDGVNSRDYSPQATSSEEPDVIIDALLSEPEEVLAQLEEVLELIRQRRGQAKTQRGRALAMPVFAPHTVAVDHFPAVTKNRPIVDLMELIARTGRISNVQLLLRAERAESHILPGGQMFSLTMFGSDMLRSMAMDDNWQPGAAQRRAAAFAWLGESC